MSRRSNMNKVNYHKSTIPGERIYTDISYIKQVSYGGSSNWILIVDECTKMKWSFFCNKRSCIGEIISNFVKELSLTCNKEVRFIRCDNAGENDLIEVKLRDIGMGTKVEKTAPYTPEQNGIVERPFQTLYNSVRSILKHVNVKLFSRVKICVESSKIDTYLEVSQVKNYMMCPYEKFYGKKPKFWDHLRVFGELAIINNSSHNRFSCKLNNRGEKSMFIGYSTHHSMGTFKFIKVRNKK